jgi:hypothetical protein
MKTNILHRLARRALRYVGYDLRVLPKAATNAAIGAGTGISRGVPALSRHPAAYLHQVNTSIHYLVVPERR